MIKKTNNKKRYNSYIKTENRDNKKNNYKKTNDTNNKRKNYRKSNKNRPNLEKYKDIRNLESCAFEFKFNIFGKPVYDKKEILKTFGVYAENRDRFEKQLKYYSEYHRTEIIKKFNIIFKTINNIKKKDLKYIYNCINFDIPLYLSNSSHALIATQKMQICLYKGLKDKKYSLTFKLPDIFSIIKLTQLMPFDFNNNNSHDDKFYYFLNHSLKGFIYEPDDISLGYFMNCKEANRKFANLCCKITDDKENLNRNILDLLDYTSDEFMKYIVIKNFNTKKEFEKI